ncbi:MAG: VOC family protein [Sphingopyxis sp.]
MAVTGIGGVFFRAQNPQALAKWYRDRLGIGPGCRADGAGPADENPADERAAGEQPGDEWVWQVAAGPVVFAPFAADTDYFPADRAYMLNLRVSDLDDVLAPFRAAGDDVMTKAEWDDPALGRFARVHDPEGNPIELWEPPAPSAG